MYFSCAALCWGAAVILTLTNKTSHILISLVIMSILLNKSYLKLMQVAWEWDDFLTLGTVYERTV